MTYRVIIQPVAERNIRQQVEWIVAQSNSPATALRWARSIRAKVDTLKTSPLRCPIDPDAEAYGEEVRILLHGKRSKKFRIYFVIRGDAVHIVAVRHSAQQGLADDLEDDNAEPIH
jgi:plasmid stabilization system protein ParE